MAQDPSTTSELRINVTPRNRANLRRLKTNSIQSYQRWEKENELLYAMIEDESAWLSSLFPDAFITPELFFYALEDGTVLCLLANFIQEMAENYGARTGKRIPGKKFTFHKSKKGSRESKLFHSRENVDKFLTWCRLHGIPEAILFESNDAVQVEECRTGGREIVICLMEIARRSSRYEIEEVPQLIRLEREIEEEELIDVQSCAEEHQALLLDTSVVNTETPGDRSPIDSDSGVESVFEEGGDSTSPRLSEFMADDAAPESTRFVPKSKSTKKVEGDKKPQRVSQKESNSLLESSQPKTELDKKVCKIAQEYNIKIVHRLKEGKYIILGKTMFVRMLNDHLLVRIGGGWDTLEHYVMTHAAKPTVSEGISTTPPNSSDRKNSGVWSKLVDKVKRRESQPNLTDSPVVISKRERPESSPSVYRLRDRVKKKLSITEKDEKEISNAIRKIETSLTHSNSPSFTSKTFFQLKNRFDYKGRKSSRENIFAKRENRKMTDQNNELFTGEQQEQETKHEINGTTMVSQPEQPLEPETTETSQRVIEEFSSSTTTVTECSSSEVRFDSGTDDFQDDVTDGAQNIRPAEEDLLLIGDLQSGHTVTESERQSEAQSFPTTDTDIFSNQNEPLFLSETLQPERPEPELQGEKEDLTHKDDEEESRVELPFEVDQRAPKESETAFFPELAGKIESQPTATFPEAGEAEPSPFVLGAQENQPEPNIVDQPDPNIVDHPDPNIVDQPDPNIQEQPENVPQVAPAGDEAELVPEVAGEIETEPVKLSPEAGETEFAPFGLVAEENQPEPYKENQAGEIETEPVKLSPEAGETESAPFGLVAEENQPEPYKENQAGEIKTEPVKLSHEAGETESAPFDLVAEENQPEPYQEDQPESYQENQLAGVDDELSELPMEHFEKMSDKIERPCDDGPTDQIINDDLQATSMAMETHSIAISREEEQLQENESGKDLSENMDTGEQELEDKNSPETSPETDFVQHTESGVVFVADSEEFADEKKQSNINVEEEHKDETVSSPETEEIPPVEQQNVEVKAEHVDKIEEKKEVKVAPVDKSVAAVDHKKPTKKSPGTTKTEHEKATNISTFKNTAKDQKAERPKGSATKPTSAKTSKTTTTTTASKTKTKQPSPGVHAATKRPASAQTHKIDSTTSKPAAKKLATNGPSKTGHKTTSKPSEPRKTPNTTNGRPISTKRPTSNGTPKSEPPKSRPQSTASKVASTKTADKTDGKVGSTSRPASAKPKPPTSATTRTTIKKKTTTKTSGGPASKSEVSKTTTKTNKGGVTSSTTTTIVTKTTEPGGKSKASRETKTTAPHQKAAPVKNKTCEVKSGPHAKPGTATTKQKPASGSTRGKPASTASKGKPSSERPKSPSKGKAKETTVAKDVAEVPSEGTPAIGPSDTATPLITEESKDRVTTVVEHTEMIEDDGQTKIVHTKEVTETVLENGEQQTITTETSLEESA